MADKETIIGPNTRISGEMRGNEDVIVQGRVEGRVVLDAIFTIEESAIVQADVEARVVLISGILVGNVSASENIRLAEKARVVGDLTAPRVVMEDGATYKGRLDMGLSAEADEHLRSRQSSDAGRSQPPRMSVPTRVSVTAASVTPAKAPPPVPPPRLAAAIGAPDAEPPPSLPSAEEAAAGGVASPAGWAKKKLNRRS